MSDQLRCTMCQDVGWVFDAKDRNGVVTLEVLPCLMPDCCMSGHPVELVSVENLRLQNVSRHPTERYIMSISHVGIKGWERVEMIKETDA